MHPLRCSAGAGDSVPPTCNFHENTTGNVKSPLHLHMACAKIQAVFVLTRSAAFRPRIRGRFFACKEANAACAGQKRFKGISGWPGVFYLPSLCSPPQTANFTRAPPVKPDGDA